MKTLLVYYSLEGNTDWVARKIAEEIDTDILRLIPKKKRPMIGPLKFIIGGKSVIFREKPKLEEYDISVEDYDCVILATPVWASGFAPALRTFLAENDLSQKRVAIVACSGSGNAKKCMLKLRKAAGNPRVSATLSLVNPRKKQSMENEEKILDFCGKIGLLKMKARNQKDGMA